MTTGLLKVVETAISVLNTERNVHFEALPTIEGVFQSDVILKTETITMVIDCRKGFPDSFPVLSIKDPVRFYPHVDALGKICLFEESAIIIRTELPDQIILDAFDRAIEILEITPGSTEYKREVAREFNAYWAQNSNRIIYVNLDKHGRNVYEELICVSCDNSIILSETKLDSEYLLQNYFGKKIVNKTEIPCTILRLRSFDVPPIQKQYSWKLLRSFIMKNITGSQKTRFQKFLNQKMKMLNRFIILSIPSEDQDFLVGFWVHYQGRHYYKVEKNVNCHVEPIMTIPIDYEYMLKRGGSGARGLRNKSVLLIGCGSIGGYIAANLCQIGIGPPIMMKFCALATQPFGVPTVASLNTIMIDGTGMCGGCRVTVGGKTKFVCVDGPEFDAHQVDWDLMMKRMGAFKPLEQRAKEHVCNLFKGI